MSAIEPGDDATEVNGVRLAWREWAGGDERPPVLLIHGLDSSKQIWDLVGPNLGRERRVVALDQRGHGAGDDSDGDKDIEQIVRDVRVMSEALGLRLPVVVGHAWGASVALAYASLYPYGVSAIVLVDGGVTDVRPWPGASWEFRPADYFEAVICPVTIVLADRSSADERERASLALKQQGADAALMGLRRSSDRRLVWFSETSLDIPLQRPAELAAEIESTIATLDDE